MIVKGSMRTRAGNLRRVWGSFDFHPHLDNHVEGQDTVERFLCDTDHDIISLCVYMSYRGGDNLVSIRRHPDRTGYLHVKAVDRKVVSWVNLKDLRVDKALKLGAMVEARRTLFRYVIRAPCMRKDRR
jgi:sugar phosphate isomerase/epimerase